MGLSRRRFLAALAALPFVDRALEVLEGMAPVEGPIRLRRVTGRIEITEELAAKMKASKSAFLTWAEDEFPRMGAELNAELARQYEPTVRVVTAHDFEWQEAPELEGLIGPFERVEFGGPYFETSDLIEIPVDLGVQTSARSSA